MTENSRKNTQKDPLLGKRHHKNESDLLPIDQHAMRIGFTLREAEEIKRIYALDKTTNLDEEDRIFHEKEETETRGEFNKKQSAD